MFSKELSPRKNRNLPPQITLRLMDLLPFRRIHEEFMFLNHPKPAYITALWRVTGRNRRLKAYHGRRQRPEIGL